MSNISKNSRRAIPHVQPPSIKIPSDDDLWLEPETPNVTFLFEHFLQEGLLAKHQVKKIIELSDKILKQEPNMLDLSSPITVCGDIHGQYFDLAKLLQIVKGKDWNGNLDFLASKQLLFLGDYVDRGCYSIECYLLLLALKIRWPDRIWLLRGNHECRHLTAYFTFRKECQVKYCGEIYNLTCSSFDSLPLAACIDSKFFCVHGGISPELRELDDLKSIDRFRDPPRSTLFCDLLWSDPHSDFGNEDSSEHFIKNRTRGCSYFYTFAGVTSFLKRNNLLCIIRGHEAQENGYKLYQMGQSGFPTVVTLFSAPNYVDTYKNKAAILNYDGKNFNLRQFTYSPHPFCLPNFMDALTWSLPFTCDKLVIILLAILRSADNAKAKEKENLQKDSSITKHIASIKAFSQLHSRLMNLRMKREAITELKVENEPIHPFLDVIHSEEVSEKFEDARKSDLVNEHYPVVDGTLSFHIASPVSE